MNEDQPPKEVPSKVFDFGAAPSFNDTSTVIPELIPAIDLVQVRNIHISTNYATDDDEDYVNDNEPLGYGNAISVTEGEEDSDEDTEVESDSQDEDTVVEDDDDDDEEGVEYVEKTKKAKQLIEKTVNAVGTDGGSGDKKELIEEELSGKHIKKPIEMVGGDVVQ